MKKNIIKITLVILVVTGIIIGLGIFTMNQYKNSSILKKQPLNNMIKDSLENNTELDLGSDRLGSNDVLDLDPNLNIISLYIEYQADTDVVEYQVESSVGTSLLDPIHTKNNKYLFYKYNSRDIFELGDQIIFNGINTFVYAIETNYIGSELVHTYWLNTNQQITLSNYQNHTLIGVSLLGKIEEVKKDKVKIKINNDIAQEQYKWFDYATVYSSSDDTGWYFMPEIGDRTRLHFPTEYEYESYVISAVHEGDRADADVKSIRTKYMKEIIFNPDSIFISNGQGSEIELHDEKGIRIQSTGKISILSKDNIMMSAQSSISVISKDSVTLEQTNNQIVIDDTIDITAGHVRIR